MKLLLDTNAILFYSEHSDRLSQRAYELIEQSENEIFVSAVSAAELACLQERTKRIALPDHWKPWFRRQVNANGWNCLPLTLEVMEEAFSLPDPIHRDPADRVLIATARLERMTLVTADRQILDYPHVLSIH